MNNTMYMLIQLGLEKGPNCISMDMASCKRTTNQQRLVTSWGTARVLCISHNEALALKLCLNSKLSSDEGIVGSNTTVCAADIILVKLDEQMNGYFHTDIQTEILWNLRLSFSVCLFLFLFSNIHAFMKRKDSVNAQAYDSQITI